MLRCPAFPSAALHSGPAAGFIRRTGYFIVNDCGFSFLSGENYFFYVHRSFSSGYNVTV